MIVTVNLAKGAIAMSRSGCQHHPLQLVGSIVGTMFLHEAQRNTQNHHDGDHDRRPLIAQEEGRSRKREQE